jgi:hypothetical protein
VVGYGAMMKAFGSGFVVLSWCCCGMSVVALWYDTCIPQSHRMNILGTYIRAVHVRKDHGPFGGPFANTEACIENGPKGPVKRTSELLLRSFCRDFKKSTPKFVVKGPSKGAKRTGSYCHVNDPIVIFAAKPAESLTSRNVTQSDRAAINSASYCWLENELYSQASTGAQK